MPPDTANPTPQWDALVSLVAALTGAVITKTDLSYAVARDAIRHAIYVGYEAERLVELLDIPPALLIAIYTAEGNDAEGAWNEGYEAGNEDAAQPGHDTPNPYSPGS